MVALKRTLHRLAAARACPTRPASPPPAIFISGETGTGKGLAARALHLEGAFAATPFVRIDCASWTGAMELPETGTLFLDEIGECARPLQSQLAALLERRGRAGVISASHRDLDRMVAEGRFTADLLFRLRVLTVRVPALRERRDDILPLARHFTAMHGARYGKRAMILSEDVQRALLLHEWPGNVRELMNVVEQAVLLAPCDIIASDHVDPCIPVPTRARGVALSRSRMEAAIEAAGYNVARAARQLGVSRDVLRYRIRKLGMVSVTSRGE
jgi:DNA-binding NtrC family response regulator